MLCVIPFWAGDVDATRILLNWIKRLGGCHKHQVLLVVDAGVNWAEALELPEMAARMFGDAYMEVTEDPQEGWPQGPNWLFKTAAQFAKEINEPFFFLEPDAVPLKPGWLDGLEAEYTASGKPFMGALMDCDMPGLPNRYLAGVACYPPNAIDIIGPCIDARPHVAWDVSAAGVVVPQAVNTAMIQHFWGTHRLSPTFAATRVNGQPNIMLKADLWEKALVFHRNKDGSLIRLLGGESPYLVTHGGDVGDLIYGLAAMKQLGQCRLVLHWAPVREGFSLQKFEKLYPLLAMQPYLSSVTFRQQMPETRWDFNKFRPRNYEKRAQGKHGQRETLAQSHLRLFNLPENVLNEQWMCVDKVTIIPGKKVVFHRSPRYRNRNFPWKAIADFYRDIAVFVGMPDEHKDFCNQFGKVDYHPTADYLELARVIAGSLLFVGNQSCPYAIAEALKQNAILEVCPGGEDCQFYRPNCQNDPKGRVHLWEVKDLERVSTLNAA